MPDSMLQFTLVSPMELKDEITDQLLTFEGISGFNLVPIRGYSKQHSSFDIEAQVRGYKNFVQFEVIILTTEVENLKKVLSVSCPGAKLRFWCLPIFELGHL